MRPRGIKQVKNRTIRKRTENPYKTDTGQTLTRAETNKKESENCTLPPQGHDQRLEIKFESLEAMYIEEKINNPNHRPKINLKT